MCRYDSRFSSWSRSRSHARIRSSASACVKPSSSPGLGVHRPVVRDHRQLCQRVVAADVVVLRVVAGRDLERARSEVQLDALVRDHGHAPLDPGDDHLAPDERFVALVVGVHGDRDVREDRRRPRRRDRDVPVAVRERVADVRQRVVGLDVRELEVGERRQVEGAPVDDSVRAVDPAPVPEVDEEAHDRAHVRLVHREPLTAVVERGADAPELEHDLAAVLVEPFPDELDERLAAEILP